MQKAQTLPTLPFGQPPPQIDASGHRGLGEVGRAHRYDSITIPVSATTNSLTSIDDLVLAWRRPTRQRKR